MITLTEKLIVTVFLGLVWMCIVTAKLKAYHLRAVDKTAAISKL